MDRLIGAREIIEMRGHYGSYKLIHQVFEAILWEHDTSVSKKPIKKDVLYVSLLGPMNQSDSDINTARQKEEGRATFVGDQSQMESYLKSMKDSIVTML